MSIGIIAGIPEDIEDLDEDLDAGDLVHAEEGSAELGMDSDDELLDGEEVDVLEGEESEEEEWEEGRESYQGKIIQ